ncbi:hypothetical protein COO60DRAFT_1669753 [Scenedesmus sp. NREL 46B-D3]|nr:hypothetical protein COO60DRAFT_1669753 [Scenedesmus sp. NREL 46B-D3]
MGGGSGVSCPRGTYTDAYNKAPACTPCRTGLTTAAEGSSAAGGCKLARAGFYVQESRLSNAADEQQTQPLQQTVVRATAAAEDGSSKPAADTLAEYVAVPCFGIEYDLDSNTRRAVPCVENSYGQSAPSFDLVATRCIPCPDGTATPDVQSGVAAASGYTSALACSPLPGWATQHWGRSSAARSVQGGDGLPQPCGKGSYSPGGSADAPGGSCTSCPRGFTTQEPAAEGPDECNICSAGNGGAGCLPCSYGTYSFGGSPHGCRPCQQGHTSARGAESSAQCVVTWPQELDSYTTQLPVSDEGAWTDVAAGDASEQACKAGCGAGCIMYHYATGEGKCRVLLALTPDAAGFSSRAAVGFKAFSGGAVLDYAFFYIPASLMLGVQIRDVGSVTLGECLRACSRSEACVLVRVTGDAAGSSSSLNSCALFTGQLDPDSITSYQVAPQHLLSDGFEVNTL